MARYDVTVTATAPAIVGPAAGPVLRSRVRARSAEGAQQVARGEMFLSGIDPRQPWAMTVRRCGLPRPGVRTRTFSGGSGPGDPAGVREPRRPSPQPPVLRRRLG